MANEYLNNRTFESIIQAFQYFKRQKSKFELVLIDLRETNNRRQTKYGDDLKKEQLQEAEVLYKEACDRYNDFKNQLAYAFYVLAENIANYAKFSGIDIDDAIQEGVLICFEKIDRFDPRKGKAFNYMTTCILNHYRQQYRSVKHYNELMKRYHVFLSERFETTVFRNGKERISTRSPLDRETNLW